MKRWALLLSVFALVLVQPQFAQGPNANPAVLKAKAQNVPEIPYEPVSNFLKMPADVYFGESIGVATNSKGHVFVYDRGHETRFFELDETASFFASLAKACTDSCSRTWCGSIRKIISGPWMRGRTCSSSSTLKGESKC